MTPPSRRSNLSCTVCPKQFVSTELCLESCPARSPLAALQPLSGDSECGLAPGKRVRYLSVFGRREALSLIVARAESYKLLVPEAAPGT